MKTLNVLLVALALACAGPALADKGGKGKKGKHEDAAAEHAPGKNGEHGPPTFSGGERGEIEHYFSANPGARGQLPPGLAKQGKVPPGWAKKLERGKPVPADLWELRVPLPHDILIKLPPPPPGVVLVRIHDHVLKVREHTHEVLDKIGLPHPP
jgi:hypothetical protein